MQIHICVGARCTAGLSARASWGENDHGRRRSGGYRARSDVLFTRPHSRRVRHGGLGRTTREISVRAAVQGQGSTAIGGRVVKSIEAPRRQGTASCTAGWILHVRVTVSSIRMSFGMQFKYLDIPRGDGSCRGPVSAHTSWRGIADLRVWSKMRATFHPRGWSRSLNHFNRVVIFSGAVSTTFVALLLQDLLRFGISKAQKQLYPIVLGDVVEFHQDLFGNITVFEAVNQSEKVMRVKEGICFFTVQSPLPCSHLSSHRD